jgi:predicted lactoylglutathione lyase
VQSNGITHVLNLAVEDVKTGQEFYKDIGAKYFEVFADDHPEELWDSNFKSSSLPVDRKYQKWQSRDNYIILLFNSKYKRQWINVIFSAG